MGQSAEEQISGLKRNAPAVPHKSRKRRGKGGGHGEREEGTQKERRERRGNQGTKSKCEDRKEPIPPLLVCSLSGDFMTNNAAQRRGQGSIPERLIRDQKSPVVLPQGRSRPHQTTSPGL